MKKNKKPDLEHGYVCKCGAYQVFSVWVYAHLDIEITHTCTCGRKNHLLNRGVIYSVSPEGKVEDFYEK